ncbi:glycosyltransferase involved in cell wall biosynthesis [Chitinophaga dinghuensis]|uniref:Glycosyltransferase involved in cell wall biosynthesis n=1 Tax=Chitinophaga dinghuensis TaxID=1539050 RepID=A0A327VQJ3_9BACT|nr:glycosyltransferase family 2 protein [Chitinophaga dinghuensis]RAJ77451.1 glycosyltransferase involved in cell wall biosynthesis [Chitinophaga dinghuensis]
MTDSSISTSEKLISIIIATYNAEKHLASCLRSISEMRLPQLEILIIDGNSTDQTIAIAHTFPQLDIQLISEKDEGIYDALNKGVRIAKGKWLHFLGSDDELLPGFRDIALQLKDTDTVYYGNSEELYRDDFRPPYILLKGPYSKYRLAKFPMNHQSVFYPAAVFKKYQYDQRYRVFADYALNLQVWGDSAFRRKHLPVSVTLYNMSGFSAMHEDKIFKQEKPRLIKQHLGRYIYWRYLLKRLKNKQSGI